MKYPRLVSMPSAVSDWLEEQLEARGIDAVVYTRYILSLLHTDSVDVIYSDEDLHFSHFRKEVRRSGGGRKRIRRSSDWWRYGQTDPEKLKRSAAVECLMSASEQTYGIESLIDELCEKLKAVKSEVHSPVDPAPLPKKNCELQRVSPQELAKRYYAAFPPLSRNSSNSPSKIVSLVPKWIPSPKKKNIATPSNTNNRKLNNKSINCEGRLHCRMDLESMKSRTGKQRLGNYFNRNKKEFGRNFAKSVDVKNKWDFNSYVKNQPKTASSDWPQSNENLKIEEMASESDHCIDNSEWNNDDDMLNLYDDVRQNISDLLDESDEIPTTLQQQDENVEMVNIANMRDTPNKRFLQHGIGITSSIWSNEKAQNDDDSNNVHVDSIVALQALINMQFSAVSLDDDTNYKNMKNEWITEYMNKSVDFEVKAKQCTETNEGEWIADFLNKPLELQSSDDKNTNSEIWNYSFTHNEKWSEVSGSSNDDDPLTLSLIKINHNQEASPFVEVNPKPRTHPLLKPSNIVASNSNNSSHGTTVRTIEVAVNKDDLFNSITCHFRPIKDPLHNNSQCEYSDGQTFSINRAFDRLNYRRTPFGGLYLENDYAMKKKYYEYKTTTSNLLLPLSPNIYPNFGLVLKFMVSPNNKECQTDEEDAVLKVSSSSSQFDSSCVTKSNFTSIEDECKCQLEQNRMSSTTLDCPVHSMSKLSGFVGGGMLWKKESEICKKCCANWKSEKSLNIDEIDDKKMENIWGGDSIWSCGEVCRSCLGRPPSTLQQSQLRESVSQDGDQLLSEIGAQMTSIQQAFGEGLSPTMDVDVHLNLNEILPRRERKYNSLIGYEENSGPWSFATRIEEDCFKQMSAMPSLRCTL